MICENLWIIFSRVLWLIKMDEHENHWKVHFSNYRLSIDNFQPVIVKISFSTIFVLIFKNSCDLKMKMFLFFFLPTIWKVNYLLSILKNL
jgi:hypothetical protein